jgi:hypothetical protein
MITDTHLFRGMRNALSLFQMTEECVDSCEREIFGTYINV